MKKAILMVLVSLVFLLFPLKAAAADTSIMIEEQLRMSGVEQLLPLIPEESGSITDGENLLKNGVSDWTVSGVFSWIWETIQAKVTEPLRLFLTICGILLLAALLEAFSEKMEQTSVSGTFSAVVTLAISTVLVTSITGSIRGAARVIDELSQFVLSFIPVFSGVAAVAGRPAGAAVYQSVTFAAAQFFSQIAANAVVPLLGIFLAICTVGAVSDVVDVQSVAQSVKKAASWLLGLCLTIFVGLLSLQSMVAGAADTIGNRTARFVISSTIPVVGGALSEAYSSLFGCLGVVKSSIGVFGIVVMAITFLPLLLDLALKMLALNLGGMIGDLLGLKRSSGVLRAASSALSILTGLILCYGMMILVSVTIMLLMGTP